MPSAEWYADGLRFSCTQCGNCCTGPRGYVWFSDEERGAMAEFLGVDPDTFLHRYAHRADGAWTLNEVRRGKDYDCVFLRHDERTGHRTCSIYPVRPRQCRTWPFWTENLRSRRAWAATARATPCPGMAAGLEGEGTFYPIEKIRIQRDATSHD